MLVAQSMTNLDAQAHQFRLIPLEEFFDFDDKHIVQIDLSDNHRAAGFIECQHIPFCMNVLRGSETAMSLPCSDVRRRRFSPGIPLIKRVSVRAVSCLLCQFLLCELSALSS